MEALVNCKNEDLIKYSKGNYNATLFVESARENWDLTDKQIGMTYLISDLAINAKGVFSIAHCTFIEMFENRFKMKISLSSVKRFFNILSNIGLLTIHAAKRKNGKQSANIFIMEPIEEEKILEKEIELPDEPPCELVDEPVDEPHNNTLNITKNITPNKPLMNNFVNNNDVNTFRIQSNEIISNYYTEFAPGRWNKNQYLTITNTFIDEVIEENRHKTIYNLDSYIYNALKSIARKSDLKYGKVKHTYYKNSVGTVQFYDWLNATENLDELEVY